MRRIFESLPSGVYLLGLFMLSLLPRLVGLGRYITPDELIWVFRTVRFREAVLAGQWADSLVSGHPGVVTTWLGMLGIGGQLLLRPADAVVYRWLTHLAFFMPDNMAAFMQLAVFLPSARLMVAIVNSLGITAVYLAARRLWPSGVAGLAALLLALDPFVVGLSGILHVDALMTTFATLTLLTLLLAVDEQTARFRWGIAAVSGLTAALAILSKTPALLLVPVAGLVFVVAIGQAWRAGNGRVRQLIYAGLMWGTAVLVTILALYPALWSAPGDVLGLLSGNANRHIEEALRPTFFLGRVAFDHGPLFYPVVLLFRLSPVVLLGLIVGAVLPGRKQRALAGAGRKTILLLAWAVLYIAGISFAAKKFDRYALAVIPALIILAAVGWDRLIQLKPTWRRYLAPILLGMQAMYLIAFLPYPLAAYNPLAGGPWVAQKALPLGWGEVVSAAGRWLAEQPGAVEKTAVTSIAPALAPFFPGQTSLASSENLAQADFVILTANGQQTASSPWPDLPAEFSLRHTIRYGGIEQGWIYAQPDPQESALSLTELTEPVSFGGRVGLLATGAVATADKLDFTVRWRLLDGGENGRFTIKLALRDTAGHVWNSREWELVNEVYFYPEHWTAGETPQKRYSLDLPPGLPPGQYDLELALFADSGAQLPLLGNDGQFQGVVWQQPDLAITTGVATDLSLPNPAPTGDLAPGLILLGYADLPPSVVTGGTAVIDLFWQATDQLPAGLELMLSLGEANLHRYPISRFDSGRWSPGQQLHEKYSLAVPPQMAGGRYPLRVQIVGEDTAVTLGQMEIVAADRLFRLPEDIEMPLNFNFDGQIHLRGLDWPTAAARPGDDVALTLYWQTDTQPDALISAFVHLVGPDGQNVAQADRWPGGLPSDTWAADEVIVDAYAITLPPDAPPGHYQVAVGLYTAVDGVRLAAMDAAGTAVPDNRVILPLTLTVEADGE